MRDSGVVVDVPINVAVDADATQPGLAGVASRGAGLLIARYLVVGLLNLVAVTFLVRRLGPENWASYATGLFIANFVDQYLGPRLLGSVVHAKAVSPQILAAAAFTSQLGGVLVFTVVLALALPVDARNLERIRFHPRGNDLFVIRRISSER